MGLAPPTVQPLEHHAVLLEDLSELSNSFDTLIH